MFGYFELVKNFEYLTNEYGMDLIESRLRSSFPYAVWSNGKINISTQMIENEYTNLNSIGELSRSFAMKSL